MEGWPADCRMFFREVDLRQAFSKLEKRRSHASLLQVEHEVIDGADALLQRPSPRLQAKTIHFYVSVRK